MSLTREGAVARWSQHLPCHLMWCSLCTNAQLGNILNENCLLQEVGVGSLRSVVSVVGVKDNRSDPWARNSTMQSRSNEQRAAATLCAPVCSAFPEISQITALKRLLAPTETPHILLSTLHSSLKTAFYSEVWFHLWFQSFPQIFYLKDFTEASCKMVNNKTFSKPHIPLRTDHYIFQFNIHSA